MDEQTETTSLWNTRTEDLTVGDAIKLNCYILAAMAGGVVVISVGSVAYDKIGTKFRQRRDARRAARNAHLTVVDEKDED